MRINVQLADSLTTRLLGENLVQPGHTPDLMPKLIKQNGAFYLKFIYTSILPACVYTYHVHCWCPQRSEESVRSPRLGVTGDCELIHWCWDSNLGPRPKNKYSSLLSHLLAHKKVHETVNVQQMASRNGELIFSKTCFTAITREK